MELDTCIISLKIIAQLKVGQRIISTEQYINIEPPSLIPEFIRRWKRGDSRDRSIKLLNVIINNSIHHFERGHLDIRYLQECIEGFHNLQATYMDDYQSVSRLDTILDRIMKVCPLDCPIK